MAAAATAAAAATGGAAILAAATAADRRTAGRNCATGGQHVYACARLDDASCLGAGLAGHVPLSTGASLTALHLVVHFCALCERVVVLIQPHRKQTRIYNF